MKEMQVKSEFKVHKSVLYLDKNVENLLGNKYLLSLGYDEQIDPNNGAVLQTALVFKVWDFISLDSKYFILFLTTFYRLRKLRPTGPHRWHSLGQGCQRPNGPHDPNDVQN